LRLVEIGLKELDNQIMKMAELSKRAFELSTNAIEERRASELRDEVKEMVGKLGQLREEVNELALEIIARYQPVAKDLRKVKASLELSYAFFRFARYAYDALSAFARLESLGVKCEPKHFASLAPIVKSMIEGSIDALKNMDVLKAMKIITKDDEVDETYHSMLMDIIKNYENVPCAVVEALSIKFLERAADHSVQVASQVVFVVEGRYPE